MNENAVGLISLANELESFIQHRVSASTTLSKYGGTLFTVRPDEKEGQFCGVFIFSKHVQISFSKGSLLNDPRNVLKGSGKSRRHINYGSANEVDFDYLGELVDQSCRL